SNGSGRTRAEFIMGRARGENQGMGEDQEGGDSAAQRRGAPPPGRLAVVASDAPPGGERACYGTLAASVRTRGESWTTSSFCALPARPSGRSRGHARAFAPTPWVPGPCPPPSSARDLPPRRSTRS